MSKRTSEWSQWEHQQQGSGSLSNSSASFSQRLPLQTQASSTPLSNSADPSLHYPHSAQQNSHYYYAPASPGMHSLNTTNHQYQPRQPPSLNIAAVTAAAASTAEQRHQPYSAPVMGTNTYYGVHGASLSAPYMSSAQSASQQAGYGSAATHHLGIAAQNGNASFMLPSQQQQHAQQQPPAPSTGLYGQTNGMSYGMHGTGMPASHLSSAPHSFSSFHHRISGATSHSDLGVMASHGNGPYDYHHHSAFDGSNGNGFLATHGFDANGMMSLKPKRKQVKNACINCQKACKRCDEGRPCSRCVKYGLTSTCMDSARKERKRGIKRGPYKRRATTGSQPNTMSSASSLMHTSTSSMMTSPSNGTSSQYGGTNASNGHYSTAAIANLSNFNGETTQQLSHHPAGSPFSPHLRSAGGSNVANDRFSRSHAHEHPSIGSFGPSSPAFEAEQQDESKHIASATGSAQRSVMPFGSLSYETNSGSSPALYGREHGQLSMQPPSGRPSVSRMEYDRAGAGYSSSTSSGSSSSFYSNAVRLGTGASVGYSTEQPGSANSFSLDTNTGSTSGNGSQPLGVSATHRHGTVPSLCSPPTVATASNGGHNGFLSANSHHRLHSESSLAPLSNGSGATPSNHSPRTPLDLGSVSENNGSVGANLSSISPLGGAGMGKGNNSMSNGGIYNHHPAATTMSALAPSTTGAFLNPPLGSSNQPFPLHMPQSAKFRGNNSGNGGEPRARLGFSREEKSPHSNGGGMAEGCGGEMAALKSELAPLKQSETNNDHITPPSLRYQLLASRSGSSDGRTRHLLTKMETSTSDLTAYGAA